MNDACAPRLQQHWDWRAAGNFIGGGSGGGLLLATALATLVAPPFLPAAALGLALVATGLGLVWMELGRPWRSLHVFFHPQTSWMTREAALAIPLFASGLAALWFGSLALLWLAGLFAAGFVYCQARILRAARGIPAWRHPRVVPLVLATAATEGLGGLTLLAALAPAGGRLGETGALALLPLLALRALAWSGYRRALTGQAPAAALAVLARLHGPYLWLGHALPAILAGLALAGAGTAATLAAACAGLVAMATGGLMKFVLLRRAAYNQGYAIEHTAARGGRPGPGCRPGWG